MATGDRLGRVPLVMNPLALEVILSNTHRQSANGTNRTLVVVGLVSALTRSGRTRDIVPDEAWRWVTSQLHPHFVAF
ncbi:MAG TPA: hypothetical protein VJ323_21260 [Bryobacteraceae bacterium]|jgi:hypothetical protein|nr:hypothetical protein [Bryobacteraceae bacterium]